jgi:Ca-activated chloride channel family protein
MADITGGSYYRAEDAEQLYDVFSSLPNEIILQKEKFEISAIFSLLSAAFVASAVLHGLIWYRFP